MPQITARPMPAGLIAPGPITSQSAGPAPEIAAPKGARKRKGARAILKDALPCSAADQRATAPRGEYEIERGGDCVGLCSCATKNRFTLSFDAFLQHLNEGRISLVNR